MPRPPLAAPRVPRLVAATLAALAAGAAVARPADAAPLSLHPPALEAPEHVQVTDARRDLRLDPRRDYVVHMPPHPLEVPYGLQITGGRHVVLVGGHIRVPRQGPRANGRERRGLYLKDQRGTIHVEGLLIDGPDAAEGINLDERRGARVQLANIRVTGLHARDDVGFTDTHPDVLQTWGGPTELHVDGLTGTTNHQGLFLDPTRYGSPEPRLVSLRRVDLSATSGSGYLLWRHRSFPLRVEDVWVQPHATKSEWETLWPDPGAWPGVRIGRPPGGDFVPAGSAGLGYRSPGYAAGPAPVAAPSGRPDLARNRPAIASSTYPGRDLARGAVDGDPATRWGSPYAERHWWQVDLGAERRIDEVRVDWERAYASRYRISTSLDGRTFTTAAEPAAVGPGPVTTRFAPRPARHVRISGLRRATRWGISFWDVQIRGPEG